MSKRGPNETPASSGPSAKKVKIDSVLEMGPVSGQEEFDIKVRQPYQLVYSVRSYIIEDSYIAIALTCRVGAGVAFNK